MVHQGGEIVADMTPLADDLLDAMQAVVEDQGHGIDPSAGSDSTEFGIGR